MKKNALKNLSLSTLLSYPENLLSEDARLIKNYFIRLIRIMPNNIYWMDKNGIALGANDNVLKFIGLKHLEDFIGLSYEEIIKIAGWDENKGLSFKKDDEEVIRTGKAKSNVVEPVFYDDNGNEVHYISSRIPLFDDEKNVVGVVGISIDIAHRKATEELRLKNVIIEEKMETMRLLAASIAHEIRTPLASIKALSGIAESALPTLLEVYENALKEEKVKRPLRKLQLNTLKNLPEELDHITSSTNTFIDMLLAKVNLENMKHKNLPLTRLSIKEALMEALLHYPFDEHSMNLIDCNYTKPFNFNGDKILFQHIIFNLLKNAIYHVRASGRPGKISLWFEHQPDKNTLHFKDTGAGISAENLPHIFNSFYSRTRHATGVGLAFCKLIMESFGGKIHCDSIEGKYTHFMLDFPKMEMDKK